MNDKPIAVLISDVHYNMQNLQLASQALSEAVRLSNKLNVGLIIAGDLHDTKAAHRAECIDSMVEELKKADQEPTIIIGNHDLINERDNTKHSLGFLSRYAHIVAEKPWGKNGFWLAPYQIDVKSFEAWLKSLPTGDTVIMHQGLKGTDAGEYFSDKTAIDYESCSHLRVISGHYHKRQSHGNFDYIGTPYTMTFAESNDPTKGIQILYESGKLQFVSLGLRKHVIVHIELGKYELGIEREIMAQDKVWVKVCGPADKLFALTKDDVRKITRILTDFRLEKIPTLEQSDLKKESNKTPQELLDILIEAFPGMSPNQKIRMKELWRSL